MQYSARLKTDQGQNLQWNSDTDSKGMLDTSQNCPGTGPASIIPHDLSLTESAPVAQPHKGLPTSVTDSFKWTSERPPRNSDDICSLACQRLPRGVTWICEPRKGCPAAKRPSQTLYLLPISSLYFYSSLT